MKRTNFFHGLMLIGLLGSAAPALADAVTDWNEITVQAATVGRPGPIGIIDIALVQVRCTMPCRQSIANSSRITRR